MFEKSKFFRKLKINFLIELNGGWCMYNYISCGTAWEIIIQIPVHSPHECQLEITREGFLYLHNNTSSACGWLHKEA